jgi:hypothetical protein
VYTSAEEELYRFSVYVENLEFIEAENARQDSYVLAENKYTDLPHDEFLKRYVGNGLRHAEELEHEAVANLEIGYTVPNKAMDWRKMNAVNPPRDQGQCRCGYAFATVGAVEGYYAINIGHLSKLSEQQIIDCT